MRIDPNKVRELASAGLTDGQIAAEIGACKSAVLRTRHRLGVRPAYDPSNPPEHVRQSRLKVYKLLADRGHATQRAKRERLCDRYGLPHCLDPTQVKILLALADGAATADEVRRRCGWGPRKKLGGDQRNWMGRLIRGGFVVAFRRPISSGRGSGRHVYQLTLKTLEMLSEQPANPSGVAEGDAVGGGEGGGQVPRHESGGGVRAGRLRERGE